MSSYIPEWDSPESPTRSLSHTAMLKYYKDHSVRGWCQFYLTNPGSTSEPLLTAIGALLMDCQNREKPAHRKLRDELLRAWRREAAERNWHLWYGPKPVKVVSLLTGPPAYRPGVVVPGPRCAASLVARYRRAA